jgi:uncharacterized repeat protein (TIGR03803 family)
LTALASFNETNGRYPQAGLVEDSSGNLFGTAGQGGASGTGTVFEIAAGSGVITTLASFNGTNGAFPVSSLVEDSIGNLFGTTLNGGTYNVGTVFEVVKGSGVITTLASFNGTNGADPDAGLVEDSSGNLFGTTTESGPVSTIGGYGTVFEIAHNSGVITTLASFFYLNGAYPEAGLVEDSSGNLFGTTENGGTYYDGTVFEVVKGRGAVTTLASFNGTNGAAPLAGLVEDNSGNLFGTTTNDGLLGYGTVFEIVHGSGVITTLASFNDTNGENPESSLIEDSSGNLFGDTTAGGVSNDGTVFEVAKGSGAISTLASFNGTNGELAFGLVADSNGNLSGTASEGGSFEDGTVFELSATPITFSIDTTPPTVSITAEPPAVSNSTSASFSFTGSDPTSGGVLSGVNYFQYQLDNGGYQTAASPVNLTGLTYGSHTFQVEAVDNAGNVSTPASYTWTIAPVTISSVAVNGSSAVINIVSATGDGTTATITTDGTPHGFWVGELVTLTGVAPGGPGGLAGTVTVTGVPSATTFQFASTYSGSETLSGATVTAAPAGAQRSMVDSIVYNFNEPVNLTAAAFFINVVVNNTNTGSEVGVAPTLNVAAVPFTNEWVVTFTDPTNNSVIGNSIANGAYSIAINPALVTAVSGGQNLSSGETDTFYRLYGDMTGAQSVTGVDVNAFNRAYGNAAYAAGFVAALDYNGDGSYTGIDVNAFNRAFNTRYNCATTI